MSLIIKLIGFVLCPIIFYLCRAKSTEPEEQPVEKPSEPIEQATAEEDIELEEDFSIEDLIQTSHKEKS